MAGFTSEEYTDMLVVYGMADCNGREARRIYQERYPNRRVPNHQTFGLTYRRLRETGNLNFREPAVNRVQPEAKSDTKKRGRPAAPTRTKESTKSSDDEQAPAAKRGRGRPKGSKKKAAKGKSAPVEGRGRGRPRKDPPPKKDAASTEEEQDEDEDDEGSEEQ